MTTVLRNQAVYVSECRLERGTFTSSKFGEYACEFCKGQFVSCLSHCQPLKDSVSRRWLGECVVNKWLVFVWQCRGPYLQQSLVTFRSVFSQCRQVSRSVWADGDSSAWHFLHILFPDFFGRGFFSFSASKLTKLHLERNHATCRKAVQKMYLLCTADQTQNAQIRTAGWLLQKMYDCGKGRMRFEFSALIFCILITVVLCVRFERHSGSPRCRLTR